MRNITLISDWKLRDPYVAILKGQITTHLNDVTIFDLTHAIEPLRLDQTAFILKSSYSFFPEKTVHLILTGTSFSSQTLPVVVECNNHYFIAEDNGVFSMMLEEEDNFMARQYRTSQNNNFIEKVIAMIASIFGGTLEENTDPYTKLMNKRMAKAIDFMEDNSIEGQIVYIDSTCNAITNIPTEMFLSARKNRNFTATIRSSKHITITTFYDHYTPKENGVYFILNRLGYLEITMYQANIAILGNMKVGDPVKIQFH